MFARAAYRVRAVASASVAVAQSIEPRAYSNAPVGVNFLLAGPYTRAAACFRYGPAGHRSAAQDLERWCWVTRGRWTCGARRESSTSSCLHLAVGIGVLPRRSGRARDRRVRGPALRLSVNFYGAPALTLAEFKAYEQDLIVGASLQVSVPAGQYDSTKLVNIGTNRWSFKPEIGASKALGAWTLELKAGVTLFTTNTDFFNGNRRSRIRCIRSSGTRSTSSDPGSGPASMHVFRRRPHDARRQPQNDLQQNWRLGGTWPSRWTLATRSSST